MLPEEKEEILAQVDNRMHQVLYNNLRGGNVMRVGLGNLSWYIEYALGDRIDYGWIVEAFIERKILRRLPGTPDLLYVSKSLRESKIEDMLASGEKTVRILNRHNIQCHFDPSERSIKFDSWEDVAEVAAFLAKR